MRISILSDSNWEAKVSHAERCLTLRSHFANLSYGTGLLAVTIVLNARDPQLGHRQRVRFVKSEKKLYLDVMLDLKAMIEASHQETRDIVCGAVCRELTAIMRQRRFPDFDAVGFLTEFEGAIQKDLQGADATRFDHLSLARTSQ